MYIVNRAIKSISILRCHLRLPSDVVSSCFPIKIVQALCIFYDEEFLERTTPCRQLSEQHHYEGQAEKEPVARRHQPDIPVLSQSRLLAIHRLLYKTLRHLSVRQHVSAFQITNCKLCRITPQRTNASHRRWHQVC